MADVAGQPTSSETATSEGGDGSEPNRQRSVIVVSLRSEQRKFDGSHRQILQFTRWQIMWKQMVANFRKHTLILFMHIYFKV